jgi:hypothetical protein
MLAWTSFSKFALAGCAMALVAGCVVESEPSQASGSGGSGSSSGGSGASCTTTPASQPMLVDVDPNQTMNASPGDGVGVFIQYMSGGHWDVWWTCDTNKTNLSCAFDNVVTVATGAISNLQGQSLGPSDSVTQQSSQKIEAVTTTSTGISGMTFDTPLSAGQTPVITVSSALNGCDYGQYFFFVQNGAINGNYQGMLTDPLMLEPKVP